MTKKVKKPNFKLIYAEGNPDPALDLMTDEMFNTIEGALDTIVEDPITGEITVCATAEDARKLEEFVNSDRLVIEK